MEHSDRKNNFGSIEKLIWGAWGKYNLGSQEIMAKF